jgi:hypothetical protein
VEDSRTKGDGQIKDRWRLNEGQAKGTWWTYKGQVEDKD